MLLRDILSGEDPQVAAAAQVIAHVGPDILLLTGFDFDAGGAALGAFADKIGTAGQDYPHLVALRPNTGRQSGIDLDGDGRLGEPEDMQSYGAFAGQWGMALLSRYPVDSDGILDFSAFLWDDLPGAILPDSMGAEIRAVQRLSTIGHWDVPVLLPGGRTVRLLAFHASPPVFDGPEDRNGRRNHDEAAFWLRYLDGSLGLPGPKGPFVLLGDANLDTADGDGRPGALDKLISHPALQDPRPASAGGPEDARREGGANRAHRGDSALDTANWRDDGAGPGNLRVDYVLPSRHWEVTGSGVFWPRQDDPLREMIGRDGNRASRHRLVWVDLRPAWPGPLP